MSAPYALSRVQHATKMMLLFSSAKCPHNLPRCKTSCHSALTVSWHIANVKVEIEWHRSAIFFGFQIGSGVAAQ